MINRALAQNWPVVVDQRDEVAEGMSRESRIAKPAVSYSKPMSRNVPLGIVERTIRTYTVPGRTMSSVYFLWPVALPPSSFSVPSSRGVSRCPPAAVLLRRIPSRFAPFVGIIRYRKIYRRR